MSSVLFLIGKTLGKYAVLEHIGHGGMSEVYKGQHAQLDRKVAVKVLHPFLAGEEGFVTRFKREAQIVATLRHPNIMQVYDFDYNQELDIYYMVMEYIDGPTLKIRLAEGPMPQEEAVRIGIAIADALDYAHQRGMVHRDVKPANIMFMPDGQPVLTDFGIAKMLTLSGLTASGAMVGTPAYMAPEVGMGKPGTAFSDIYSLGVVLYQMIAGRLIFESDSPMGMVMQHINETPPPLTQFVRSLPPGLEAVIFKALAKTPEQRFGRAAEMAAALRQVIGMDAYSAAQTVSPPPPAALAPTPAALTPPPVSKRASRRKDAGGSENDRLLRTWPVSLDKKPLVRTPTLFPLMKTDTPPPEPPVARPRRSLWARVAGALLLLLVIAGVGAVAWLGIRGDLAPYVQQLRALSAAVGLSVAREATAEAAPVTSMPDNPVAVMTQTPTATPTTVATSETTTPGAVQTEMPALTPAATAVCAPRIRLNLVRVEPENAVFPETPISAYVSLRNTGTCAWPAGLQLTLASGERMNAPAVISVEPLSAGESMQVILSLRAPLVAGVYTSTWEVRQSAGQVLGTAMPVVIEVTAIPTPTPTPTPRLRAQPTHTATPTLPPLKLEPPVLASWSDDSAAGTWSGVLTLQAGGGVGHYRYYRGEIREETLLPGGQLTFTWQRCEALPLTVWAVSGADVVRWEGWIAYPAAQNCR